ncbi:MAG TPA: hypothetical protein DCZ04_08330 [Syntrophorhabdus aromaticivorans]|nr:hypothetical protein [Syntrophorhabdus aromaticivorans]
MSEQKDVCCSGEVMACSGASNAGRIANNVMIELDRKGVGYAYCLAGIGTALSGFVETARVARTVVIDGCPVGCEKRHLKNTALSLHAISSLPSWALRRPTVSVNSKGKQKPC